MAQEQFLPPSRLPFVWFGPLVAPRIGWQMLQAQSSSMIEVDASSPTKRIFQICGAIFCLACVSAAVCTDRSYLGEVAQTPSASSRNLLETVSCSAPAKTCPGGWKVLPQPMSSGSGCYYGECPHNWNGIGHGPGGATYIHKGTGGLSGDGDELRYGNGAVGTTNAPKHLGAIIGGSIAGAVVVGGAIAGAVALSKPGLGEEGGPTVAPTYRLYSETDAMKPAAFLSNGLLVGIATFGVFASVFLAITGVIYIIKRGDALSRAEK